MYRNRSRAAQPIIASLALVASGVFAQVSEEPTLLGQTVRDSDGSNLQVSTGNAVQTLCGNLATTGGYGAVAGSARAPTSPQEDLFYRCNEMVHTAISINSGQPFGNSLGLTGSELGRAMQQLAGEENASMGRLATESSNGQFANIGLRLDALARGARVTTGPLATAGRDVGSFGGNAGDREGSGWGWFATGAVGFGDRRVSAREDAYDYSAQGVTFGADYQLPGGPVLGAALGYSRFDVDFLDLSPGTLASTAAGGSIDVDGFSLSFFGLGEVGRVMIDGVLIYGRNDYDTERSVRYEAGEDAMGRADGLSVDRTMTGATDGTQWAGGISIGTAFDRGATTIYLDGGLTYLDVKVDGYSEIDPAVNGGLNLAFDQQKIESRQARIGLHVTRAFSRPNGVISPFLQLEWRHELENGARTRTARYVHALGGTNEDLVFVTDPPDKSFGEAGVGVMFVLRNNFQLVLDYRTSVQLDLVDANLVSFGFRGGF